MLANIANTVQTGGPVVYILVVLSLISLTLIAVKVIQLRDCRSGIATRDNALDLWRTAQHENAEAAVAGGKSPADRVVHYAMMALRTGFAGAALDAELTRQGNEEMARMITFIRVLELIAMISPLLGLLGTVLGMIQSFQELALAEGAANASLLAAGIWKALLTTAAGLLVAIPAAIGATLLSARIESSVHLIESAVGKLMLIEARKS